MGDPLWVAKILLLFYFVNDGLLISVGEKPNNGGWSAEKYSRLGGMEKLE